MITVCAWCPRDPREQAVKGASHTICPDCQKRINDDLDRREAAISPRRPLQTRLRRWLVSLFPRR